MPLEPRILLTTASDERFPADAMLDGNMKSFFLTTGMFPHEVLLSFSDDNAPVNITKVSLVGHGIKKLRVERCTEQYATAFEPMVDCEVNASGEGGLQQETYQINKATVGQGVRYVKLVLAEGHEPFAAIHSLVFEGEKGASA
uniref:F5/8 type C domain-containing protein n=1 Tax=Neobodo designis TaxID=312471 RepID=A0A7S1W7T1_NEODS|mmetsp:Transcript_5922/g.18683  ORF Transcript_5922/g.18683 Transcript_5922/m.18683 type:complete len:143 (+) Transcript_5922:114-542(+)